MDQTGTLARPAAADPAIAEIVARLVACYKPERIYLFGSAARGDSHPGSDYDVMVVVPDDAPAEMLGHSKPREAIRDLRSGFDVNVQVWRAGRFNRQLHLQSSFPATIVREGRLLYKLDPVLRENTREWVKKSTAGLGRVELFLSQNPPDLEAALYFCQQSAEKALKAFLTWHDRPFPKTHKIEELGALCAALDPLFGPIANSSAILSPYVWVYRYPGDTAEPVPPPTPEQAQQALAVARDVFEAVHRSLPPELLS